LLRATPWASQQKSRTAIVSAGRFSEDVLDQYCALELPTVLRATKETGKQAAGYYPTTSALRGFVAENLANQRRWYHGFATAVTAEKTPRYIHYYWERDGLGALRFEERKGLVAMTNHLHEAEEVLVTSVQQALRQRFGQIAAETEGLPRQTRLNRFDNERERLRLAFAG